jgi:hypothetical protein
MQHDKSDLTATPPACGPHIPQGSVLRPFPHDAYARDFRDPFDTVAAELLGFELIIGSFGSSSLTKLPERPG